MDVESEAETVIKTEIELPRAHNFKRTSRVLACRPHIKAFYYSLSLVAGIWLLFALLGIATFGLSESHILSLWPSVIAVAVPSLLLVVAFFLVRPLAFTRAELRKDSLIVRRHEQEIELFFKDIDHVNLSQLPYMAGWITVVMKDKTSYTLSVALERSEYILESLVEFNPQLADAKKVELYRQTAIYYDHSWARLSDRVKDRLKLRLKYGLGAFLLTVAYGLIVGNQTRQYPKLLEITLVMCAVFLFLVSLGAVLWFSSELFILSPLSRKKLKADSSRAVRPIEFEKRIELLSDIIFILIAIGALIAVTP